MKFSRPDYSTMQNQIHIQPTIELLWQDFAEWFQAQILDAQKGGQEAFHMAIPGGQTPDSLFQYLAGPAGDKIPWDSIHFWWTDERCVPITDARSN